MLIRQTSVVSATLKFVPRPNVQLNRPARIEINSNQIDGGVKMLRKMRVLLVAFALGALASGCGGGSSSGGGGEAAGGVTADMRGTWNGIIGSATFVMTITEATGGSSAGSVEFSNGNGGPISLSKEGNSLAVVVEFENSDCVGRFNGALTTANRAQGNYVESGSTCGFRGDWSMER
ncbi:MAG: hypothetical protein U5R46_02700 [Gammaproteobacteria bacterium]|nr:hypothetical protein [Gammaproteobacteria bacterium]